MNVENSVECQNSTLTPTKTQNTIGQSVQVWKTVWNAKTIH